MNTSNTLQRMLATSKVPHAGRAFKKQAPYVVCADGATISVQASRIHCCHPRDDEGPYTKVEVGFPTNVDEMPASWKEYATDADQAVADIYAFIPIELVAQFIDEHGGFTTTI